MSPDRSYVLAVGALSFCNAIIGTGISITTRQDRSCRSAPAAPQTLPRGLIGKILQEDLKQPFIVENRPGAGRCHRDARRREGTGRRLYAADDVECPDGKRISIAATKLRPDARLRPGRPHQHIRPCHGDPSGGASQNAWRSSSPSPKRNPGKLNYASSGQGTPYPMAGELFKVMQPALQHRPRSTSRQRRSPQQCHRRADRNDDRRRSPPWRRTLRPDRYARSQQPGQTRSSVLPDVPTVAEAGVPGYEATIWLGIMAPAGTAATNRRPIEQRHQHRYQATRCR